MHVSLLSPLGVRISLSFSVARKRKQLQLPSRLTIFKKDVDYCQISSWSLNEFSDKCVDNQGNMNTAVDYNQIF
jgi:hypothetical protein